MPNHIQEHAENVSFAKSLIRSDAKDIESAFFDYLKQKEESKSASARDTARKKWKEYKQNAPADETSSARGKGSNGSRASKKVRSQIYAKRNEREQRQKENAFTSRLRDRCKRILQTARAIIAKEKKSTTKVDKDEISDSDDDINPEFQNMKSPDSWEDDYESE